MDITIETLAELPEKPHGIVFWWSNILRGYQLRVYAGDGSFEPEIRLTREEAETEARLLAARHGLHIYEIVIPRLENGMLTERQSRQ